MHTRDQESVCAGCGSPLSRAQLICPECGTTRQPRRLTRCRHCGTLNRREHRTCVACDLPLGVPWLQVLGATAALLLVAAVLVAAGPWLRAQLAPAASPRAVEPGQPTQAAGVALIPTRATSTGTRVTLPTASITPTSAPPPTASATSAPATQPPTATPSPTASLAPTDTPSPTASPSPTATSSPTATPSPTATTTPSSTPTITPSRTPTATVTPTTTITATGQASPSPTPVIYIVKAGDNLYDIARRFGVTVAAIKKANNLKDDRLRIGQKLIIPLP